MRYTITTDASYKSERAVVGIGIVIQATDRPGRRGLVIERLSEAYAGIAPAVMEEFAVPRALEISSERGYRKIRVRSDYNWMRRKLRSDAGRPLDWIQGGLHRNVLELAATFDEIKFARMGSHLSNVVFGLGAAMPGAAKSLK
jgi:ribonuclease HI